MRIFLNKSFQRFANKESIDIDSLCLAVQRADAGQVDADLGGGVIKQRIARSNEGKSGGYRSIILYRTETLAFFVYGYAKNERDNITADELKAFKKLAKTVLNFDTEQLEASITAGVFIEVACDG